MALKYNPITGEFEEEKPVALSDLVFDPISGEFKAPESKTVVPNESNDLLAQFKQTIRVMLEKNRVKPGVTTVQDMVRLGYMAENHTSFVILSKSGPYSNLISNDKNYIDRIYIRGSELSQFTLWNYDRKFADWCSLFKQLGFVVKVCDCPYRYKNYYAAKFEATDAINGIKLSIDIFYCLKSSFFIELTVPIYKLFVEYDIKKINQFNTWLYGPENRVNQQTGNHSEKSFGITCDKTENQIIESEQSDGITGDKTVKQIIESPLGDANVDFTTATYDSLREWIRKNGMLEEKGDWMFYRNVPTKLLGYQIKSICIFKQANGFGAITNLDFRYRERGYIINNLQKVIEIGKTISNQLQEIGFPMRAGTLLNTKFYKFKREGELQHRKVSVEITDYEDYSSLKIRLYVTK